MLTIPLRINQIKQKDNYTFSVIWNDGKEQDFRLSLIQRMCPCASCRDEKTGQPLLDPKMVKEDVRAKAIRSVGRYALQILFTSGCSSGIYSFEMLHRMKDKG